MLVRMWEVPPEPGRARRATDEALRRVDDELLSGPPFPVYGVAAPRLDAETLAEAESLSGGVHAVGLYCGELFAASGPLVYVRSVLLGLDDEAAMAEPELADVVADERDRLYDHAGIEEPEPSEVVEGGASLVIAHRPRAVEIRREGSVWAARVTLRPGEEAGFDVAVTVTVVGRGVAVDAVRLDTVDDLGPYLRGRDQLPGQVLDRMPGLPPPEDWDLPPAHGFEAHLALVQASLAEIEAGRRATREGRQYRVRRGAAHTHQMLRESAVRAQMKLATQTRHEAEDAVLSLINHLVRLAEEAPWFSDPVLRQAAIEESVRYQVFDSDVPSRPAQEAWRSVPRTAAGAEWDQVEFLGAWQHWADRRR